MARTITGSAMETTSGMVGTPCAFRRLKLRGISPSLDIMNMRPMSAAAAVLTALKSSTANVMPTNHPKACPICGPRASPA